MIYLDGADLPVQTVLDMAKGVRDNSTAEHYLLALFYEADVHEDRWLRSECRDIMQKRGMFRSPDLPASEGNLPDDPSLEKEAKRYFKGLSEGNQLKLLREAMKQLRDSNVFNKKQHWIGVFLVLRDRLSGDSKQSHFTEYAKKFTPDDFPEDLKIGSTMTNASKTVFMDKLYYEMENNPYEAVCDTFWDIILNLIRPNLTKI